MISLKKYWDAVGGPSEEPANGNGNGHGNGSGKSILPATIDAYRAALLEMGSCSLDVCPALGEGLNKSLGQLVENLALKVSPQSIEATRKSVGEQLKAWGERTAAHFRQTTGEVKEILIVMARTAESVGERDKRCAVQLNQVTSRLKMIARLEDLTAIRASIEQSAVDLKTSVDRMAAEGKAAVAELQAELVVYRGKLEAAEELASRDALTGLRNRLWVESQLERLVAGKGLLCVAILDINGFKQVNDEHGHLVGDELLRSFSGELKSACRSTDLQGRWGGDEFILVLECGLAEAQAQIERLRQWVCGSYKVQSRTGPIQLMVNASIGLAKRVPGDTMKELLARADAAMYQNKSESKAGQPAHAR